MDPLTSAAEPARVASLRLRIGTEGDAVIQVRSDGEIVTEPAGPQVRVGELVDWTWAMVKSARKDLGSLRAFELRPGPVDNAIRVGGLEVTGRFEIVRTINNRGEAETAWKARAR